uniref:Rho GTPase-activating protein 40-like n=1 Tax=Castor canadensis TaxID=51338 RepID=A0A8B7TLQ8_CASCN
MTQSAFLPAAWMERLALVPLALPCPRIPRARITKQPGCWVHLGISSGPSAGPGNLPLQERPPARCSVLCSAWEKSLFVNGFWMEMQRIQQRDEQKEEDGRGEAQLPEGEAEAQWLQDTGLSSLVGGPGLDGDHQGLLSTLTQTQVTAVCRRLDVYARSARRRHKAPIRDVRNIFGVFSSGEVSLENGDSGMKRTQLSSRASKSPPGTAEPDRPQEQAGREEVFNMDAAYSEQAASLLQRARPSQGGTCAWGKGPLPKFRVAKGRLGRLGVTRIGDLSSQDMKKVPPLALIELTALCDILGLDLKRSKAGKWKAPGQPLRRNLGDA